jgi:hypothetical protein
MALGIGLGLQSASRAFDPAAASFFVRAGITNPTQQSAVNKLVKDLKAAGIWTKMLALYPFVGGTAAQHSFNLVSSSFQITWTGGVTHNANGVTGNGTTGFGNTGCKPTDLGLFGGFSSYVRVIPAGDNNYSIGSTDGAGRLYGLILQVTSASKTAVYGEDFVFATAAGAVAAGFYSCNRIAAADLKLYFNGSSIATQTFSSAISAAAVNFYVLAQNNNGTAALFSEDNSALAALHQGLTAGENTSFYNAVQTYQTTLGRNV